MQATKREYVVLSFEELGFSCVMLGVPFTCFVLKCILKHLSVRLNGSAMSFSDPPGTVSFFSKPISSGGDTKSVPNRIHAVEVVLCSGAALQNTEGHENPGAKINLCWVTQRGKGQMGHQVFMSAEGPVHTLCKLSSTSYRRADSLLLYKPRSKEKTMPVEITHDPSSFRRAMNVHILHCCVSVGDHGHSHRELLNKMNRLVITAWLGCP